MQKKYITLMDQLIQGYHLEQNELEDLKKYLLSQVKQIELREEKKVIEGKKLITTHDNYKFEQISKQEAMEIWKRKGDLFYVNIYDKQDGKIEDEKLFKEILNSREDVFCIDSL